MSDKRYIPVRNKDERYVFVHNIDNGEIFSSKVVVAPSSENMFHVESIAQTVEAIPEILSICDTFRMGYMNVGRFDFFMSQTKNETLKELLKIMKSKEMSLNASIVKIRELQIEIISAADR